VVESSPSGVSFTSLGVPCPHKPSAPGSVVGGFLLETELKAEWKREQQKEIIVRFKRELKPDNSLVSIWKPFILPRQGGGINGISGCKLARTCSVRIADMIILVRLGFQQLC
jgi:hypothetical protein